MPVKQIKPKENDGDVPKFYCGNLINNLLISKCMTCFLLILMNNLQIWYAQYFGISIGTEPYSYF